MDISNFRASIKRVSGQNFNIQTQAIASMVGEVANFVTQIAEEEAIASQAVNLRREVERLKRSDDENDKQKAQEAQDAYEEAEQLKRHISLKKSELRNLKNKLDQIQTEIRKVIN